MTGFGSDLIAVGQGVVHRVVFAARQVRRTTAGPALIRLTAGLAAAAALVLSSPGASVGGFTLFAMLATMVGLFPRSWWVTGVLLGAVMTWLLTTLLAEREPAPARVALFAAALYLTHASAAFAAVLPYDCLVAPVVVVRWAGRTCVVLAVSLTVGIGGLTLAAQLARLPTTAGPTAGVLVAAGLVGLLVWQLRRR